MLHGAPALSIPRAERAPSRSICSGGNGRGQWQSPRDSNYLAISIIISCPPALAVLECSRPIIGQPIVGQSSAFATGQRYSQQAGALRTRRRARCLLGYQRALQYNACRDRKIIARVCWLIPPGSPRCEFLGYHCDLEHLPPLLRVEGVSTLEATADKPNLTGRFTARTGSARGRGAAWERRRSGFLPRPPTGLPQRDFRNRSRCGLRSSGWAPGSRCRAGAT